MHAAENNKLGVFALRSHHRKLIRIAGQIRVLDYVVALIMMTENDDASRTRCVRSDEILDERRTG